MCECWQRTVRACLHPTGSWRNSEYFCARGTTQYSSTLLLKNQVFLCTGSDQFVLVGLQVRAVHEPEVSVQHRLHEHAFLQEHPCCFKGHKYELLGCTRKTAVSLYPLKACKIVKLYSSPWYQSNEVPHLHFKSKSTAHQNVFPPTYSKSVHQNLVNSALVSAGETLFTPQQNSAPSMYM